MSTGRQLRVGIVCPYSFARPGGVQNHVFGLAQWLQREGHEVSVLAPGHPEPEVLADHELTSRQFTTAGPGVPVPFNGSVARINFGPLVAARVGRWVRGGGFDVVHVHEPITPSVSLLATGLSPAPVVATFHTANAGSSVMAVAQRLVPHANARIRAGIAVSSVAQRVAHRPGLEVIGNGIWVDEHPFAATTGAWRGGDHPVLTFIGRYSEPRKGLDVLRGALDRILAAHPNLEVLVIGQGLPVHEPRIRFLGSLPNAERNQVLARSDVYLAPQTGRESFGIVLLEAMASGAPVVASDLPAFREVVSDPSGPVAELFEPGNPDALADAALRSLAMPRDTRLERGRALAEAHDWSAIGPRVLRSYRTAIA